MKRSKFVLTQSVEIVTKHWKHINWPKVQKYVFKLQRRIYSASLDNNFSVLRQNLYIYEVSSFQ